MAKRKFLHRVDPRVLELAQLCDVVSETGWTLEYIDRQPAGLIADMAAYWTVRNAVRQAQRQ